MRKQSESKAIPKKKSLPPRFATELIREEFIERSSRKGYLTRDFCIGRRWYRWTSNSVCKDGILRHGILDDRVDMMGGIGSGIRPGQMRRDLRFVWIINFIFEHRSVDSADKVFQIAYKSHTGCGIDQFRRDLKWLCEIGGLNRKAKLGGSFRYSVLPL